MADELDPKQDEEIKIDELDDGELNSASGGGTLQNPDDTTGPTVNEGCNCGCS
jgi:hypothetical protein